jgi:hypothetical protein
MFVLSLVTDEHLYPLLDSSVLRFYYDEYTVLLLVGY